MMKIVSEYHCGPVTAVCCLGNKVIAGVGSRLHVYSVSPVKYERVCVVLDGCNIHGILTECASNDARICVYGEKCVRLVCYNHNTTQFQFLSDVLEFSDWIWDITWLQDRDELCVALAHNSVVTWDITRGRVTARAECSETCILYTAKFLTNTWSPLVVAAGTVFNQVVIWSPDWACEHCERWAPIHRLTGHQGVIFSIDCDAKSQRICSASDDRSIRLYQLDFPRDSTSPTRDDWAGVTSSLLHVLYGHSARVWAVRLLTAGFVSVGEDATCCVWDYGGHVLHKYRGHKGKSIWSLAVAPSEQYVVTGGGDHSIRLWHLQSLGNTTTNVTTRVLPQTHDNTDTDFPRSTQLLDYTHVLVMTNEGRLVLYDLATESWTCLMEDPKFESYTVISIAPSRKWIAVGNIHGMLRLISTEYCSQPDSPLRPVDTCVYSGKVHSIHWLADAMVLTTGPLGELNVWRLEECSVGPASVTPVCRCVLPESRQRWIAAAGLSPRGDHMVCGDRAGSVLVYSIGQQNGELMKKFHKIHGKAGVTHVCWHGNQVYTTGRDGQYRLYDWLDQRLVLLNSNRVCKGFEWLERLSFTEDGDVQIQGFHTNQFVLWSVRENRRLLEVECGGGHRAWDFIGRSCHGDSSGNNGDGSGKHCHGSSNHGDSNHGDVSDNHADRSGAHGDASSNNGDQSRLVFLKVREVVVKTTEVSSHQTIVKRSLHGRELCDVKHIWSAGGASSPGQDTVHCSAVHVIATCSEDTAVCLSALISNGNGLLELRPLHTLTGHISSVRCLAVCGSHDGKHSHDATLHRKLIFSAGGRAQIKVWSVTVQLPGDTASSVLAGNTGPTQRDNCISNCLEPKKRDSDNLDRITDLQISKSNSARHGLESKVSEKASDSLENVDVTTDTRSWDSGSNIGEQQNETEAKSMITQTAGDNLLSKQQSMNRTLQQDMNDTTHAGASVAANEQQKETEYKHVITQTAGGSIPGVGEHPDRTSQHNIKTDTGNIEKQQGGTECKRATTQNAGGNILGEGDITLQHPDITLQHDATDTTATENIIDKPVITQMLPIDDSTNRERQHPDTSQHKLQDNTKRFHCAYESLGGIELGHASQRRRKSCRLKCDNSDPETRILDMTAFHGRELSETMPESLYFIAAACSDGQVRFLYFEEDTREITLIASSDFHDHCVLKVRHLFHVTEQMTHVLVATAATDGRVAFWDITSICHSVGMEIQQKHGESRDFQDSENLTNSCTWQNLESTIVAPEQTAHPRNLLRVYADRLQMHGSNPAASSMENIQIENDEFGNEGTIPNVDAEVEFTAHRISDDIREADAPSEENKGVKHRNHEVVVADKFNIQPVFVLTGHQSGVNSLHITRQTDGKYLLVTGGDDNAVQVTMVTIDVGETLTLKVVGEAGHLSAHAAQVTGVWCMAGMIITVSIDQRVCIWSLPSEWADGQLRLLECKFVSVPDIANIDMFYHQGALYLLVCGEGLELLKIAAADSPSTGGKMSNLVPSV